ncbi:hypothetical protein GALL_384100 [mine drainage metagenome]|uniref:Bacterial SH3 domain protein n=1 Tax=mine drainage metagenome TaxID=410659 RepID=A0A1J5Q9H9_9ZZZZ
MHLKATIIITLCLLLLTVGCDSCTTTNYSHKTPLASKQPVKQIFDVIGSEIFIRNGPGNNFSKIINKNATEAFKQTQYAQIDSSTKVEILDQEGEWSKIQVVEPEWLRGSHIGWVPTSCIKQSSLDSNGIRIYTEGDIIWDEFTKSHKDLILVAINKIARQHPNGPKIDTSSISMAPDRGTKADPVFFVTIGTFPKAYNIYFSKKDVESGFLSGSPSHDEKSNPNQ